MTPFEEDLKKALARVEPPDGFTERLAARIGALPARKRPPVYWRWVAAAAAAVLVSGVSYEHERQARGEAAREKLLLAMRITSSKLQQARQQIEEVESH
jgi:hypothetical protein